MKSFWRSVVSPLLLGSAVFVAAYVPPPASAKCTALLDACRKTKHCCAGVCGDIGPKRIGHCCLPEGALCASSESCCGGNFCVGGVCTDQCGKSGQTCDEPTSCCFGSFCVGGVCTCAALLDACSADVQCCEGVCTDVNPDTGIGHCCLAQGAGCASSESCCPGNFCVDGVCTDECGLTDQTCDEDPSCCSGSCVSGQCACIALLDACSADVQCCAGVCGDLHPDTGIGHCCLAEGTACGSSESCCAGNFCIDGACSDQCGTVGQTCDDGAGCCSGQCVGGECD